MGTARAFQRAASQNRRWPSRRAVSRGRRRGAARSRAPLRGADRRRERARPRVGTGCPVAWQDSPVAVVRTGAFRLVLASPRARAASPLRSVLLLVAFARPGDRVALG